MKKTIKRIAAVIRKPSIETVSETLAAIDCG